jgi:hypothetical protein
MPQTKHCASSRPLWLIVVIAMAIAGCGSGSGGSTTSDTGSSRYFGDLPGQEATEAAIGRGDCAALRRAVEDQTGIAVRGESEPSPPSSRCVLSGRGTRVSIYLDASRAARQRYYNRMVEQVQFYGTDPAKRPHAVAGVGDRSAYEHTASWIPAFSTLYAVRGNRWVTVAYSVEGVPRAQRKAAAAALARRAFRLTAD